MATSKCLLLAALLLLVAVGAAAAPLVVLNGRVPCSAGSSINAAEVPVFPNAAVRLVCGGKAIAGTTTDGSGLFSIKLGQATKKLLTSVVTNQCKVVVVTPLAQCDVSLAHVSGTLAAPVQIPGVTSLADTGSSGLGDLGGLLGIIIGLITGVVGGILNMAVSSFTVV